MFSRDIKKVFLESAKKYRAITLTGPRQSGKTTLCKMAFPKAQRLSLEALDIRERALTDPRGFLKGIKGDVIIDEFQRAPELCSYLQEILDSEIESRRFILTGSNSLSLNQTVSQSLAGRTRLFQLLPLAYSEISETLQKKDLLEILFTGGYPRIYNESLSAREWLGSYYQTYVEKDVRQILNIESLISFDRFVRLVAGRAGQLINFSSLGTEAGVSQPTATKWMSVLQASYIVFPLQPHFKNFNKQVIKSPKFYFFDTGLLCYLLRIQNPEQLDLHPLRGQIFENWVVAEAVKFYFNQGETPPIYFWRDEHGHEIDLIIDRGTHLYPIEIKSGSTYQKDFSKSLHWFNKVQGKKGGAIVFGGDENFTQEDIDIHAWTSVKALLSKPL